MHGIVLHLHYYSSTFRAHFPQCFRNFSQKFPLQNWFGTVAVLVTAFAVTTYQAAIASHGLHFAQFYNEKGEENTIMRGYPISTQQACNLTNGRFNRLNLGILADCLLIVRLKKCFSDADLFTLVKRVLTACISRIQGKM